MIDVKEAVRIAINFAKEIYPPEEFDLITLEEVELSEEEPFWYVTLGINRKVLDDPFSMLAGKTGKVLTRYKIFKIHRDSGEVISMKIRKE